jgi:hypothetical protein
LEFRFNSLLEFISELLKYLSLRLSSFEVIEVVLSSWSDDDVMEGAVGMVGTVPCAVDAMGCIPLWELTDERDGGGLAVPLVMLMLPDEELDSSPSESYPPI